MDKAIDLIAPASDSDQTLRSQLTGSSEVHSFFFPLLHIYSLHVYMKELPTWSTAISHEEGATQHECRHSMLCLTLNKGFGAVKVVMPTMARKGMQWFGMAVQWVMI